MDQVTHPSRAETFNGPLEAGLRAVAVLGAAYPATSDLERLTAYDYLLVRTHRLGGPADLHPEALIQTPATQVRREVVHDALMLMMTRDLVARVAEVDGLRYYAGEAATVFLTSLRSPYAMELKSRAAWLVDYLSDYSDEAFRELMRQLFDDWVSEFQAVEQSFGARV